MTKFKKVLISEQFIVKTVKWITYDHTQSHSVASWKVVVQLRINRCVDVSHHLIACSCRRGVCQSQWSANTTPTTRIQTEYFYSNMNSTSMGLVKLTLQVEWATKLSTFKRGLCLRHTSCCRTASAARAVLSTHSYRKWSKNTLHLLLNAAMQQLLLSRDSASFIATTRHEAQSHARGDTNSKPHFLFLRNARANVIPSWRGSSLIRNKSSVLSGYSYQIQNNNIRGLPVMDDIWDLETYITINFYGCVCLHLRGHLSERLICWPFSFHLTVLNLW